MPKRRGKKAEKPRQTVAQQIELAKAITLAFGGKIKKAPDPKLVKEALEIAER